MGSYFHQSSEVILLFKEWEVKTWKGTLLSSTLIFLLTICYESTVSYHKYLSYTLSIKKDRLTKEEQTKVSNVLKRFRRHVVSTIFYVLQLIIGYTLMLLVMTFQLNILCAVLFGVAFGYFISNPIILNGIDKLYLKEAEKRETSVNSMHMESNNLLETKRLSQVSHEADKVLI